MIRSMALVNLNGQAEINILGNLKMMKWMEKDKWDGLMVQSILDNGKMEFRMDLGEWFLVTEKLSKVIFKTIFLIKIKKIKKILNIKILILIFIRINQLILMILSNYNNKLN